MKNVYNYKDLKPKLEITTKKFVEKLEAHAGPPLYMLSIKEARNVLDTLQNEPIEKMAADILDTVINTDTPGPVSVRIVKPIGTEGLLPIIMYFHGGGWILGNKETHDRLVREIANGAHAAVVFINYTPSPEAQFPTAIEQAYAATVYFATHAQSFGFDSSRLAVVGDSVGGNMAIAVTMLAKERKFPAIKQQILFYPVTDATFASPSYEQFAQGPWLTKKAMEWFWDAYAPDRATRTNPLASPLDATIDQLKNLPPALIITDENDVLRDEGEAYAAKLMEAGVPVAATRCLGTHHDFVMLHALAKTPATRFAIDSAIETLKRTFSR